MLTHLLCTRVSRQGIIALVTTQDRHQNVSSLSSRSFHPSVSVSGFEAYGSGVTRELSQFWAPLCPGSCPWPSGQKPECTPPVWLGDREGCRRLGMKSSPRDRRATKRRGEAAQMDSEIPRSSCFPGLGILGFPSGPTSPGLNGACPWGSTLVEGDFLCFFLLFLVISHSALVQMQNSEILDIQSV